MSVKFHAAFPRGSGSQVHAKALFHLTTPGAFSSFLGGWGYSNPPAMEGYRGSALQIAYLPHGMARLSTVCPEHPPKPFQRWFPLGGRLVPWMRTRLRFQSHGRSFRELETLRNTLWGTSEYRQRGPFMLYPTACGKSVRRCSSLKRFTWATILLHRDTISWTAGSVTQDL